MRDGAPGRPKTAAARPAWLIWSTLALTLACLGMAVTETSQWGHYLIDRGELISLAGLAFIAVAGVVLYRQQRLRSSFLLTLPWLVYPAITQGDQIIDNLPIVAMQVICQVLLTIIFLLPIFVVVLGVRQLPARDARTRHTRSAMATFVLLTIELVIVYKVLGVFMIVTLALLQILTIIWWLRGGAWSTPRLFRSESAALVALLVGVGVSLGLYVGYKNRPGAYQGSPSYLFDPSQPNAGYRLDRVVVPPDAPVELPAALASDVRELMAGYAASLDTLAGGYYVLDRNYTYHFHNILFMRSWPILPNFRAVGLQKIAEARVRADAMRELAARIRPQLAGHAALAALVDEVGGYVAFNFDRATLLEPMSAEFVRTNDGLQHAAHLYEGEGALLGMQLDGILRKHAATLDAPVFGDTLVPFKVTAGAVRDRNKDRVVGF